MDFSPSGQAEARPHMRPLVRSGWTIALRGAADAVAFPIYRNGIEDDRIARLDPVVEHVVRQRDGSGVPVLLLDELRERRHIAQNRDFYLHESRYRAPACAHVRNGD